MPHPLFTLLTALLLSIAMGAVERRMNAGLRVFSWCAVTVLGGSWLMHVIHG